MGRRPEQQVVAHLTKHCSCSGACASMLGHALQEAGSAGLEAWLAAEAERRVPEYKKRWPKYYYYYEWMRERVAAACGELPAPVIDKLLAQVG